MARFFSLSAITLSVTYLLSWSVMAATPTPPPRCETPPTACEGSSLSDAIEYRSGNTYLTVFCQAEKDAVEAARDSSGQAVWTLVRTIGPLNNEPHVSAAPIRRYRYRAPGMTALRITANPGLSQSLDGDISAIADPSVACLDSDHIAYLGAAPTGDNFTKCPAGYWPLWSVQQPMALQQRWFDDPFKALDVLTRGDDAASWQYDGIAGCVKADSMVIDTKASLALSGSTTGPATYTLSLSVTHAGPPTDSPRSPKILAMIPYGYGVRTGAAPCSLLDRGAAGIDMVCAPAMLQVGQSASLSVDLVRVRNDAPPPAVRAIAVGAPYTSFPESDLRRRSAGPCSGDATPVMGCAVASAPGASFAQPLFQTPIVAPAPVLQPDSITINALASMVLSPLANDPQGVGLRLFAITQPALGRAEMIAGDAIRYTAPMVSVDSTTTFRYTTMDARGRLSSSTISVRIIAPNHPPTANPDIVSAVAGQPIRLSPLANDTDPDGDTLRIVSVGTSPFATISFDAQSVTITPSDTYEGTFTIPYTITDGKVTASSTITVNVVLPRPPASPLDNLSMAVTTRTSTSPVKFAIVSIDIGVKSDAPPTIGTPQAPMEVKLWFRLRQNSAWRTAESFWWDGRMPEQAYRVFRDTTRTITGGIALASTASADGLRVCVTATSETSPDTVCRIETATSRLSAVVPLAF